MKALVIDSLILSTMVLLLPGTGCAVDVDEPGGEELLGRVEGAEVDVLGDKREAQDEADADPAGLGGGEFDFLADPLAEQAACLLDYDQVIDDARALITANCGTISGCGSLDSTTHNDLFLSNGKYCGCYGYMWQNRASYPFNELQVIFHESGACKWPHIHLEKKNYCGFIHFDLDEGTDPITGENADRDCYDDESIIDKNFCATGARNGGCNNKCSCSQGITYWGKPVPSGDTYCGFRVCGTSNELWECTGNGWTLTGDTSCNCRCTGGKFRDGSSIDPDYTYCGYRACGMTDTIWECTGSGWVNKGIGCP